MPGQGYTGPLILPNLLQREMSKGLANGPNVLVTFPHLILRPDAAGYRLGLARGGSDFMA
jgi:hypothetical protein